MAINVRCCFLPNSSESDLILHKFRSATCLVYCDLKKQELAAYEQAQKREKQKRSIA